MPASAIPIRDRVAQSRVPATPKCKVVHGDTYACQQERQAQERMAWQDYSNRDRSNRDRSIAVQAIKPSAGLIQLPGRAATQLADTASLLDTVSLQACD